MNYLVTVQSGTRIKSYRVNAYHGPNARKIAERLFEQEDYEPILWSDLMNGDLSPKEIIRKLKAAGYEVIAKNVPSPVGEVPEGSTVFTDHNDRRAVWIDGKLFQAPDGKRT